MMRLSPDMPNVDELRTWSADRLELLINQTIAAADAEMLELFDQHRPGHATALAELAELGFPLGRWPHLLSPQVVSREAVHELEQAFQAIVGAIDLIIDQDFARDGALLCSRLGLPAQHSELLHVAREQDWARVARPDVIWDGDCLRIAELNVGTSLGGLAINTLLGRAFRRWHRGLDLVESAGLQEEDTMRLLVDNLLSGAPELRDGLLVIGVWGHEDDNMPPHFYRAFESEFARCGLRAVKAPLEDLDFSGDHVRLRGMPVAALYRFFDESDGKLPEKTRIHREVLHHVRQGSVRLIGDYVGDVFVTKAMLALVSEAADTGLLPDSAEQIRGALPWTRIVQPRGTLSDGTPVNLLLHAVQRQAQLVLKPADGHGGERVVFGGAVSPRSWKNALERAMSDAELWCLQDFVQPWAVRAAEVEDTGLCFADYTAVTGFFFIGRQYAGAIRRAGRGASLNVNPGLGAAQGCVFTT